MTLRQRLMVRPPHHSPQLQHTHYTSTAASAPHPANHSPPHPASSNAKKRAAKPSKTPKSRPIATEATAEQLESLKQRSFWGREKENLIYPIALANLVLHGIDKPNLWHGNTLTGQETYGGLFEKNEEVRENGCNIPNELKELSYLDKILMSSKC